MNSPRIAPLQPPYDTAVQADFDRIMQGREPLKLFRTIARNPRVLSRLIAGGLLDRGSISLRLRELMILRTTARCGAEYEWGVHVAAYGARAGWTPEQLRASVDTSDVRTSEAGAGEVGTWETPQERLTVRLADALHEHHQVDDGLWKELGEHFSEAQLIELVMLAGFYHAVSFLVNSFRIEAEAQAPQFPA